MICLLKYNTTCVLCGFTTAHDVSKSGVVQQDVLQ